jgi:hypothetical protein
MLMLYCKNVIYNDEVSANIFIFSYGELCDAVLEAEEQKNVVSFSRILRRILIKSLIIVSNGCYEKYRLKNVLKSVKITSNECGRDLSANKLCIYIK